ncbi:conserved hypothetical protein [Pseudomonas chlororaphis]
MGHCPDLPIWRPFLRELQVTGQVDSSPFIGHDGTVNTPRPNSAEGLFYERAVDDQPSLPPDANQAFSAGSDPGALRSRVALFGCGRAQSLSAK